MDDDLTRRAKAAIASRGAEFRAPVENVWRGGIDEQQKMADAADREMIQRIKQNDQPIEEAITQRDVFDNVMPWGSVGRVAKAATGAVKVAANAASKSGLAGRLAGTALGTAFDATYGNNTKDYIPSEDIPTGQYAARMAVDLVNGARKVPDRVARAIYPAVQQHITDKFGKI